MNSRNALAAPRRWNGPAAAMSALVVTLGATVLLGWHIHDPRITEWVPGKGPMGYNTAISFVILGAALLAASRGRRRLPAALAILGGLPSLATLLEYAAGVSLGIDELLMKSVDFPEYPGRIAPNTAVCLVLLSAALLCMLSRRGVRCRTLVSPLLASIALGLAAVSAAGYLTGFATYGWGRLVPMAVPTAAGLTLLSLAALSLNWRDRDLSASGPPAWLYRTVTVAAMVMTVSLWQALASEDRAHMERAAAGQLEIVRVSLLADMEYRIRAVARFARRWERTGLPDAQSWAFETGLLVKDVQGFEAIGWADPAFRIRRVYPAERNEALLGADLGSDPRRRTAIETARDSRRTAVTRPIGLLAGGAGINAYVPIYRDSAFEGFIVAGFRFQDLFPKLVDPTLAPGYGIAIYDGDERIYVREPKDERRGRVWESQASLQVENARWTLRLWPTPRGPAMVESTASKMVLGVGLLLSLLLGCAVYLAQAARVKTRLAERARGELEREVAERRRAEQDLDQFFTLAPDMLCIAGFDGYFKRVNAAWERVLGVPVDRLLAEPFLTFVHPDDWAATQMAFEGQKDGIGVVSHENRYRARDGSFRWLRWNSQVLPERQLIFADARDITAEKAAGEAWRHAAVELARKVGERTGELEQANRALHESEELFRRLFEESPMGTALVGADRRLTHVNKALCELLAYDASELLGLTWEDITDRDDWQPGARLLEQMIGGQIPRYRLTKRYLRKNGEIVWGDIAATILRDERGNTITVLATIENVTERRRHDEEVARLNKELRARVGELTVVNRELEAFNYSVSHDLRAPLRHIDGFSKILLEEHGAEIATPARRYLELVCEGARRMGRMIDELLELSRTSRRELARQPTGLRSLVDDVLAELRAGLEGRDIEWRIGELPFVDCDPNLTRQVFVNLLSNAVKFSRPRKPAIIEVGQMWHQGQLVLFVRDNGVGFSPKYADKLFGVFQRLHRREDFEGTGVGLATVQRIIQKHGASIWAEAELDKGATFYFTLDPPGEQRLAGEREESAVMQEEDDAERRNRDSAGRRRS